MEPRGWLFGLAAAIAALSCVRFQPDDLFIYLRVVENVLTGHGWGLNPAEAVNVASSPGWLLLLIACMAPLSAPEPLSAQLASGLCSLLAICGVVELSRRMVDHPLAAWAAGLAIGSDAWLMRWFWSGMETGLAIALTVWTLAFWVDPADRLRDRLIGALGWALLPLVRPELAVVSAIACLVDLVVTRRWRRTLLAVGAGTAVLVMWLVSSLVLWGDWLPASVRAKGSLGSAQIGVGSAGFRTLVAVLGTQLVMIVVVVWGGRSWLSRSASTAQRLMAWITVLSITGLTLLYALRHVRIYSRYAMPLTALCVVWGAALLADRSLRADLARTRRWAAVLIVLAVVINLAVASGLIAPATRDYAASMERVVRPLAERLARASAATDSIAAHNIGMLSFVTKRRIIDLNGLATPQIVPLKREGRELEYLLIDRPRWIVEVAPQVGTLDTTFKQLPLRKLDSQPFLKMFPTGPDPMYITTYQVLETPP